MNQLLNKVLNQCYSIRHLLIVAVVCASVEIATDWLREHDMQVTIDYLHGENIKLKTQVAGYEFADHSKITEYAKGK